MGQRSQILIQTPKEFFNAGNPNNKPKRLLAYHNQWLYGASFLWYANKLIGAIRHRAKYYKNTIGYTEESLPWDEIIKTSILHVNNVDIDSLTNTRPYNGEDWHKTDITEMLIYHGSIEKFLNWFDNNNGYLFLKIIDSDIIYYDIINGLEDSDKLQSRTPEEYLHLFYKKTDIDTWSTKDKAEITKILTDLNNEIKTNSFKELEEYKKEFLAIMI